MISRSHLVRSRGRLCELCVFLIEAFEGLESQFVYSVVGHSGSGPEALKLIPWGKPPMTPKEKLRLVEELRAHAQCTRRARLPTAACSPPLLALTLTRIAVGDTGRVCVCSRLAADCNPGDKTLEGTKRGIADCLSAEADEHFVFVVSDADLERYGITPSAWDKILTADARCHAYAILISQNEAEADRIVAGITPGRALMCEQTEQLASTFLTIFQHAVL